MTGGFNNSVKVFVCDLFTGQVIDELPYSEASYTRIKNAPGGWEAKISLHHPKNNHELLAPWTRSVYFTRDERVLFGGIVIQRHVELPDTMTVGGAGFFEYYRGPRRVIKSRVGTTFAGGANSYEVTFSGVDQFWIVYDLLEHAKTYAGSSNVDLDVRFHGPGFIGLSNRSRDRTYWTYERKSIGEAIEQLSAVIDGFEFSESYEWDPDSQNTITRHFDLWYPYKGIQQELQFYVGKNVVLLNRDEDGEELATRATATGAGEGDAQLQRSATNASLEYPVGPYPLLESDESYPDVSIASTATGHAEADLKAKQEVKDTIELQVAETSAIDLLGVFDIGDTIEMVGLSGGLEVDGQYRVEALKVSINENGTVGINPSMATFGASTRI